MNETRKRKIESLIREIIGSLIITQQIKDPRLSTFLTVNQVRVANDLSYAKVYIGSFQKKTTLEKAVEALNHACGFIQQRLGKRLSLRSTPKLRFFVDDSIQEAIRLNKIIDEVNNPSS